MIHDEVEAPALRKGEPRRNLLVADLLALDQRRTLPPERCWRCYHAPCACPAGEGLRGPVPPLGPPEPPRPRPDQQIQWPEPAPPGVGLAEARRQCAAVVGLELAEQQDLPLQQRAELWEQVRHLPLQQRAEIVRRFHGERREELYGEGGHVERREDSYRAADGPGGAPFRGRTYAPPSASLIAARQKRRVPAMAPGARECHCGALVALPVCPGCGAVPR